MTFIILRCALFNIKGNHILASKKGLLCFFLDITPSLELMYKTVTVREQEVGDVPVTFSRDGSFQVRGHSAQDRQTRHTGTLQRGHAVLQRHRGFHDHLGPQRTHRGGRPAQ